MSPQRLDEVREQLKDLLYCAYLIDWNKVIFMMKVLRYIWY
jgi:hypothetical protein